MCNTASKPSKNPQGDNVVPESTWENVVLIKGVEYDVTNFMKRHPGGSVIRYALANEGADATQIFDAFHMRSKKAHLVLKSLPSRAPTLSVQPGQSLTEDSKEGKMLRNFIKFEQSLKDEGFFEPSYLNNLFRISELALIFALGVYFFSLRTPFSILIGVMLHGLFGGRCGWLQHEGGHGSLTTSISAGKRIQKVLIGFGLGTSGAMWNAMHNKHHAATQKVNHDLDLDTTPLVAFFDTAIEKSKFSVKYSKIWTRLQAYTFLPFTSGVFVMLFWLMFLHPRKVIRDGDVEQGIYILSSHVLRTIIFQWATGWQSAWYSYLVGYWGAMWVSGVYLFGHFSLSHTHMDVVSEDVHKNWIRYAVDHTVDISTDSPFVNWIMGYLNCQVIHHLWPQMPQFRQPEVSRRFKQFSAENGLDYHIITYGEAWARMLGNLDTVGKHYYNLKKQQ
mmetsp:Transcript_24602/g.30085  ORF Transcript_24602/g.30085 Transcript_24602/m.30085 type:complete len:447 (+) Transcript_24602:2544-3884(+)|eukprot:CAMPEP_0204866628 /NCGR_PEP_ID=MMETSP1348-20121228/18157_1 /ASSEMBLY_ACC=CAM_ASM_000700 /TAXON_ID=215587 /ORGANISM="Aplanochytrium stocchinoi, Strain GSBS06" /LENGTH=446 /DNA_ID=CAMNT_0052018587 /DNA_START=164 /DNA_END=1504 /DNA_ORIENTATION=-